MVAGICSSDMSMSMGVARDFFFSCSSMFTDGFIVGRLGFIPCCRLIIVE